MMWATLGSIVLIAGSSPFLTSAAATHYRCKIQASYIVLDDPENPHIPSSSERIWAAEKVKSSYNAIHTRYNKDFRMPLVQYVGLTVCPVPETEEPNDATVDARSLLRGAAKVVAVKKQAIKFLKSRYNYRLTTTVFGTLGNSWNDVDDGIEAVPTSDIDEISLTGTNVHNEWVAAWCHELQHGAKLVFQETTACAITLSSCKVMAMNPNPDDEDEVVLDFIESVDVNHGSTTVGKVVDQV